MAIQQELSNSKFRRFIAGLSEEHNNVTYSTLLWSTWDQAKQTSYKCVTWSENENYDLLKLVYSKAV